MFNRNVFSELCKPFEQSDIEWRAGVTNQDKTRALALAYITSRAVMDRLDEVVGQENWRDEYKPGPDGGLICGLSLRLNDEWITKWDGAENTIVEEVKGGLSGAFKRAAVKWGIGRYLYKLENIRVPCELVGKSIILKMIPPLPNWALPGGSGVGNSEPLNPDEELITPTSSASRGDHDDLSAKGTSNDQTAREHRSPSASWDAKIVQAVISAGLSDTPLNAVKILNSSGLPRSIQPDEAVAHLMSKMQ